jgi:hypothetical protein
MAREIRITVGDDEVFERMKRRKEELDLSWEEVLKRGLEGRGARESVNIDLGGLGSFGVREEYPQWPEHGPGPGRSPAPEFGERLAREIESRVQRSLGSAFGVEPDAKFGGFEDLSEAEDAVLAFEFIDDPAAVVPLRVNLTTSVDGLDVDVVAVRSGKSARDMNRFPNDARQRVAEHLAGGGTATLRVGGAESYRVRPRLSWTRTAEGEPSVSEVDIADVVFDD